MSNCRLLRRPEVEPGLGNLARTGLARARPYAATAKGTLPVQSVSAGAPPRPGRKRRSLVRQLEAEGRLIVDRSGDRPLLHPPPGLGTLLPTGVSP